MQCPTCGDQPLYARMTQQGVEVDYCQRCHGIWLDKGEIFYFTKRPKELSRGFSGCTEVRETIVSAEPENRTAHAGNYVSWWKISPRCLSGN